MARGLATMSESDEDLRLVRRARTPLTVVPRTD